MPSNFLKNTIVLALIHRALRALLIKSRREMAGAGSGREWAGATGIGFRAAFAFKIQRELKLR